MSKETLFSQAHLLGHDVIQFRLLGERPSPTHMQLHETGYPAVVAQDGHYWSVWLFHRNAYGTEAGG